jgi:hypothetical protein
LHNLAPDLWAAYGMPWDRLDGLWWDDFVVMVHLIDSRRKAAQRERS